MHIKIAFSLLLSTFISFCSFAQLSNAQVLQLKENADDYKMTWTKLFEDGYNAKDMNRLPAARQTTEAYLTEQISKLGRMSAEGDGRDIVTAVRNYLVIQKQFVKDIMIPAESLQPGDAQTYDELNRKINDFGEKEKTFLIDISNAIRSSPEPEMRYQEPEESDQEELSEEEIKKKEEAKPRRKEKLPHELYDKKKKHNHDDEDAEDE